MHEEQIATGNGALQGLKILEVGAFIAGPLAGMLLGDLGAEVIKVEEPERGDPFRSWKDGLYSPNFAAFNRNKKSLTLNLRSPEGQEAFLRLSEQADVIIENHRPGVMDRLGIGYEIVRERNPLIIYCSLSGFGQDGPYRDRPSFDTVGQSIGGLMWMLVNPDDPKTRGTSLADGLSGMFCAYGVQAALLARERTGIGQKIETSMLQSVMGFLNETFANYFSNGAVFDVWDRPRLAQSYGFHASDNLPFAIHLSSPPKFWEGLVEAVNRPDLLNDSRFKDRVARQQHYQELYAELSPLFKLKTRQEWLDILGSYDVPVAPIYRIDEVVEDPQVKHLDALLRLEHPTEGLSVTAKNPVVFKKTPLNNPQPAPTLGEHTDTLLQSLGYTSETIQAFRANGIV